MEMQSIRLRLVFEDRSVLNETQLSDGMNQSWLLIEPAKHRKISDVCNHLLHIFDLRRSCPNGILLYMESFVLPPSESTRILKDKEILCVKRKETALTEAIEGADADNLLGYDEVNRKEPVNNGMLLLANEEFDKETGGYQSESEEEKVEDEPSPIETASKKRKASTKSRSSKKKKHRSVKDGFEDEVVTEDNNIKNDESCPMKVTKPNKEKGSAETVIVKVISPLKVKRKKKHKLGVVKGAEGEVVRDEICKIDDDKVISKKKIKPNEETKNGDAEISNKKVTSLPGSKRIEHVQDNVGGVEEAEEGKKGPSRSARRKKAKRQWRRELAAKISQKPDTDTDTEVEAAQVSKGEHKEANGHSKGHDDMGVKKKLVEKEIRKCNGNMRDSELVACVVKPGHIRFEPLNEGEDAEQVEVADVSFEWNGITSKRKGQKWGLEKYSSPHPSRDDYSQRSTKEPSPMRTVETQAPPPPPPPPMVDLNDFENLPLCTSPKEGDVIAYRLVELSSSWTPELSSYRVGKISHFDATADNIVLKPVPEYPVVLDKMEEDGLGPDNNSIYKQDGTLEIKFSGLVDVRSVKQSNANGVTPMPNNNSNENNISKHPTPVCKAVRTNKEGSNTWNEVMEALNAKKSELLLQEGNEEMNKDGGGWNRWSYRALRGSALGPTMALLRSNNNI